MNSIYEALLKSEYAEINEAIIKELTQKHYEIIYFRDSYLLFKKDTGKIFIWNINQPFVDEENCNHHTHVTGVFKGKKIIDTIVDNKRPKERDVRDLTSYLRVADFRYRHLEYIEQLIETKSRKGKGYYINVNKG